MKKANPWRGAGLLLLAPLAFVGVALWAQRQAPSASQSGPFKLIVSQAQRQDATPRDVAEGFDSRFVVSLGHKGARPAGWGQAWTNFNPGHPHWEANRTGRWARWGVVEDRKRRATRSLRYDQASDSYKLTMAMRLADVPASLGALSLRLDGFQAINQTTEERPIVPPSSLALTVRRAGEKIAAQPPPSRFCPLQTHNVSVSKVQATPDRYDVTAFFGMPLDERHHSFTLSSVEPSYFEDENGKRYPNPWRGGTVDSSASFTWNLYADNPTLKARKLTFHGRVSLDEHWPLDVEAVLWDKTALSPKK